MKHQGSSGKSFSETAFDSCQISPKNIVRTSKIIDEKLWLSKLGCSALIGVDEVGRGCLAGPVVSCAFVFDQALYEQQRQSHFSQKRFQLTDSKKLTSQQRDDLFPLLQKHPHAFGLATAQEIDQINILQATFLSMRRALEKLLQKNPEFKESLLLVDGSFCIPSLNFKKHYAVIDGDQWVSSISAASILAKVTRDRMMEALDIEMPGYQFGQHKGYGTKIHKEAIEKLGVTSQHRKSFKGVLSQNIL